MMRIALTVKGVGLGAWLDEDFAQCGFVMLVDDDDLFKSWKNPASENDDQSPQKLTELIVQLQPDILVTGKITAAQKESLTSQGINVLSDCQGFVLELLENARE
jgi:predicted Fe-Mo cluster-binding NifX family protein